LRLRIRDQALDEKGKCCIISEDENDTGGKEDHGVGKTSVSDRNAGLRQE